jgi:hypothetical protein
MTVVHPSTSHTRTGRGDVTGVPSTVTEADIGLLGASWRAEEDASQDRVDGGRNDSEDLRYACGGVVEVSGKVACAGGNGNILK